MHPNPAFRQVAEPESIAFAKARGFGALSINGSDGPLLAHVPFLFDQGKDLAVLVHLARSNAIARSTLPCPAVLAVTGPDGYISPDWYGTEDQVPTWNYVAVHLRGRLEPLPETTLEPMVNTLSDAFESRHLPKPVWKSSKMSPGVMERMMRMILPFRLVVEKVDSTWKLGQNKTPQQRRGVIDALMTQPELSAAAQLARLMARLDDG